MTARNYMSTFSNKTALQLFPSAWHDVYYVHKLQFWVLQWTSACSNQAHITIDWKWCTLPLRSVKTLLDFELIIFRNIAQIAAGARVISGFNCNNQKPAMHSLNALIMNFYGHGMKISHRKTRCLIYKKHNIVLVTGCMCYFCHFHEISKNTYIAETDLLYPRISNWSHYKYLGNVSQYGSERHYFKDFLFYVPHIWRFLLNDHRLKWWNLLSYTLFFNLTRLTTQKSCSAPYLLHSHLLNTVPGFTDVEPQDK